MLPLASSVWSTTSTRPNRRRRLAFRQEGLCCVGGSQHSTIPFDYLLAPDADDGATAHCAAVDRFQRAGRFLQADLLADRLLEVRRAEVRGDPLPERDAAVERHEHRVDAQDVHA